MSLIGTCAVIFDPADGDAFGLDAVSPVRFILGVVTAQSADGTGIRAVTDAAGAVHPVTAYTYRLPASYYPCAVFATWRATHQTACGVGSVAEVKALLHDIRHAARFRAAVIAHDLDRACACYATGWRTRPTVTGTFTVEVSRRTVSYHTETGQRLDGDARPIGTEPTEAVSYDGYDAESFGDPTAWAADHIRSRTDAREPSCYPVPDALGEHAWLSGSYQDPYRDEVVQTTVRLVGDWTGEQRAAVFRAVSRNPCTLTSGRTQTMIISDGRPRRCWPVDRDNSFETTVLVCLPTSGPLDVAAVPMLAATAVLLHLAEARLALCPAHLPVYRTAELDLPAVTNDGDHDGYGRCLAAPPSAVDPNGSAAVIAAATKLHRRWTELVAGTPPAKPWRKYIDRCIGDHGYTAARAADDFGGQPRIRAIAAAMGERTYPRDIDEYGPALQAHQLGPDTYAQFLADTVHYGETMITADGDLIPVGGTARCRVEHTLAERASYHSTADYYLSGLGPDTVLTVAHCQL